MIERVALDECRADAVERPVARFFSCLMDRLDHGAIEFAAPPIFFAAAVLRQARIPAAFEAFTSSSYPSRTVSMKWLSSKLRHSPRSITAPTTAGVWIFCLDGWGCLATSEAEVKYAGARCALQK